MTEPRLRRARPDDVPAIQELLSSESLPPFQVSEFLDGFWTIEQDGRVAGCGGLEVYGEAGVIRSVVVDRSLRGRGFGDLLSQTAITAARRRGVKRLYLFTGDAASFWQRYGFAPCTLDDFEPAAQESWQYKVMRMRPDIAVHLTPMRTELT